MPYTIHPEALQDIDELKRRTISLLSSHLVTREQAERTFMDGMRRILAQAYCESDQTPNVPIACNGCGKVVVVASDVVRYKCKCSPDRERYTFQSRKLDIPLGRSGLEDLMTAAKGRESIGTVYIPTKG